MERAPAVVTLTVMAQPKRIPWLVGGGGLTVVLVVVLVLLTTGGSDRSSPENVAQAAVDTVTDRRPDDIRSLACADSIAEWGFDPADSYAEVRNVVMAGDHRATADIRITDPTGNPYVDMPMELAEKNGEWCISSFKGTGG